MTISDKKRELAVATSQLYNTCDLSDLSFTTTAELHEKIEHLGQSRAMEALKFGIGIKHEGYNLYVMGSTGLGKNKTVNKLLDKESASAMTRPIGAISIILRSTRNRWYCNFLRVKDTSYSRIWSS